MQDETKKKKSGIKRSAKVDLFKKNRYSNSD